MTRLYSTQRRDVHVPAEGELEILFSIFLTNWTERIGPLISLDNPQFKVQDKHITVNSQILSVSNVQIYYDEDMIFDITDAMDQHRQHFKLMAWTEFRIFSQ